MLEMLFYNCVELQARDAVQLGDRGRDGGCRLNGIRTHKNRSRPCG